MVSMAIDIVTKCGGDESAVSTTQTCAIVFSGTLAIMIIIDTWVASWAITQKVAESERAALS